jgi:hypothetical protein
MGLPRESQAEPEPDPARTSPSHGHDLLPFSGGNDPDSLGGSRGVRCRQFQIKPPTDDPRFGPVLGMLVEFPCRHATEKMARRVWIPARRRLCPHPRDGTPVPIVGTVSTVGPSGSPAWATSATFASDSSTVGNVAPVENCGQKPRETRKGGPGFLRNRPFTWCFLLVGLTGFEPATI